VAACKSFWGPKLSYATSEDVLALFGATGDDDDDYNALVQGDSRHELFGWRQGDASSHHLTVNHVSTVSHLAVNINLVVAVDLDMYVSITVFGSSCPSRAMQRKAIPIHFAKPRIEHAWDADDY